MNRFLLGAVVLSLGLLPSPSLAKGAIKKQLKKITESSPMKESIKLKGSLPVGAKGGGKSSEESVGSPKTDEDTPLILRWMLRPLKKGMLVRLPIIDTDPNRGATIGFMPIWVIKESESSDRIEKIYAPSITFNQIFGPIPTMRYYYYPNDNAMLNLRMAVSNQIEREGLILYEDAHFTSHDIAFFGKLQYNVDGARRFFGVGVNTPKGDETNYAEEYIRTHISGGIPITPESPFKVHLYDKFQAWRTWNGKTPKLPPFKSRFVGVGPNRFQQTHTVGAMVDYDTRDHGVTTSRGAYVKLFGEASVRGFMSAHDVSRVGIDARYFHKSPTWPEMTTAVQLIVEQTVGPAGTPFWLLPSLGGKDNLRAYGEGRFVERGLAVLRYERRLDLYSVALAGVTTSFELAPFISFGTVFDTPARMARRYARPVFGVALRAVARPQVVGSMDFGFGQEGLAAFIDINYAF